MDYFRIGLFLRPHGVRGEVKLLPLTDDIRRFSKLKQAFVESKSGEYRQVKVVSAKLAGENAVIAKIEGIDSMDEAEKLRDMYICVDREHAVKLPEGTYFVKDIIGCRVCLDSGEQLGTLIDVYETNANDVYVIQGEKKISVPALKKLLDTVDVVNKSIVLNHVVFSEVALIED